MILEKIQQKILTNKSLQNKISEWKANKEVIVFTNGCFDILHPGHITYLAKAAELGTKIIIGINTDNSVKRIKGNNRPILDEDSRALLLASISFIDAVVFFDEDTPIKLIEKIIPNILVKGKDYKAEDIVGYDVVTKNGGKVETIDLVEGYSTTMIEKKIINLNK